MEKDPLETEPWTQQDVDLLHEMVRDYGHSRWLRKKVTWWFMWVLGLPSAVLMVWEPVVRLLKLLRQVITDRPGPF